MGKGFNRDYWERLERWCRGLTEHYAAVVVFTGPLYLANRAQDTKWYQAHISLLVSILESSNYSQIFRYDNAFAIEIVSAHSSELGLIMHSV